MSIKIVPPGPGATLAPQASSNVTGTATGPAANATLATIATPPAGLYQITVLSELSGTITAAEQDNIKLVANGVQVGKPPVQALPTTGVVQQPFTINVQLNGVNSVLIQALNAAGAAAVYTVVLIITRIA